jgi:hypothetical protein
MAIGQNFYGEGDEINNLFRSQANQSISAGYNAADLADPFRNERKGYQNSLRSLMSNPGEFSSSPVYKFAYDQGLNALQRKGSVRSGNKLAELMKYGQGMASQLYFPQANLLSNLAMSGSNPGVASAAVSGAFNRSQDQRQAGKASEMYAGGGGAKAGGAGGVPWYMQGIPGLDPSAGPMGGSLPTGGASGGYSGIPGYSNYGNYNGYGDANRGVQTFTLPSLGKDPSQMSLSELNVASGQYRYPNVGVMRDAPQFDPNNPWGNGYYNGEE